MQKVLYLFGELNDDDLDWLIATGSIEKIPPSTTLIREGEISEAVYILLEGTVVVSVAVLGSAKEIATLSSGEIFGEMSFIDRQPPSATVETVTESLVLSVPSTQLKVRLAQDLSFASRFYRAMAVFLSGRLRIALTELDFGKDFLSPELALSPALLESLPLAQARFDWLLRRVKNALMPTSPEY
jgi:CRP-like cAMP-binding protein